MGDSADPEAVRFADRVTPRPHDRFDILRRIIAVECGKQRLSCRPGSLDKHVQLAVDQVHRRALQAPIARQRPHPVSEPHILHASTR